MKSWLLILTIFTIALSASAQKKDPESLFWLEGKWNRTDVKGDAQAFEEWRIESGSLYGIGVMLSGSDTIFVERLSILRKKGNLFYIAEVAQNAEPTHFKVTRLGNNDFVCENEGHDFPKKIAYKLNDDLLTVTISGNARSRNFIFRKED